MTPQPQPPIPIKTAEEVAQMRVACRLAADVLDFVGDYVREGVTTAYLDKLCHDYMRDNGATPATLNYCPPGHTPYPKATCISLNHQVCHGIPSDAVFLKSGDILNIDITVIKAGWHGDTSRMFTVGEVSRKAAHICEVTREALRRGIGAVREGAYLGDIGHTIQRYVESWRYSVVRDYCGHGIGRRFHEPPQVMHFGAAGSGPMLRANMIFTIEPMVNAGRAKVKALADKWTVVTRDRSLSAQWEHTVRVTADGAEILTLSASEGADISDISERPAAATTAVNYS